MIRQKEFSPPPGLRGPNIQSILASARFRAAGAHPVFRNSVEKILETTRGVRLQGFYSENQDRKGLVLLLHGWEGSAQSTYIRSTARFLFDHGYSVFRLNLRDHGDSHHLNRGLFFGTLFDEVFEAADQAGQMAEGGPFFAVGFSLGGNYALRIAREASRRPISQLRRVVAVSPVLNPARATEVVDRTFLYRRYFMKKWKRSLLRKQQAYPELYDFSEVLSCNKIMGLTAALLSKYSPYKDPYQYFRGYTLVGDALLHVNVPTTIITSKDDPIIPVDDFYGLCLSPPTELLIQSYGGHNGFIENYRLCAWYERGLCELFSLDGG
ncbi:MAG: YheT family hydrolase [Desulfosalsimonas sp.]